MGYLLFFGVKGCLGAVNVCAKIHCKSFLKNVFLKQQMGPDLPKIGLEERNIFHQNDES